MMGTSLLSMPWALQQVIKWLIITIIYSICMITYLIIDRRRPLFV